MIFKKFFKSTRFSNQKKIFFFALAILLFVVVKNIYAWGFWGHQRINRIAVFTLPPEMIGFYKENIEYITEHAVDPDKRRYSDPNEAPRHYIDIDHYGKYPFDSVPRHWKDAVAKFTEDTLNAYGIVPWYVNLMEIKLTNAFAEKNKYKILRLSADIGHYIADAHVPLHCSENHNGQLSGQDGIHAFWESRVPELFQDDYDYFVGKAEYIEKPLDKIWQIILESANEVDSVLSIEKTLTEQFGEKKYSFEMKGGQQMKVFSKEFSAAYQLALNGMQERKLREAMIDVGSFWYTAWINAGKPDLTHLTQTTLSSSDSLELVNMEMKWKLGNIVGREE